jgi:LPS O-antigen subunit length determinant protein (WzzB/FepE family)
MRENKIDHVIEAMNVNDSEVRTESTRLSNIINLNRAIVISSGNNCKSAATQLTDRIQKKDFIIVSGELMIFKSVERENGVGVIRVYNYGMNEAKTCSCCHCLGSIQAEMLGMSDGAG